MIFVKSKCTKVAILFITCQKASIFPAISRQCKSERNSPYHYSPKQKSGIAAALKKSISIDYSSTTGRLARLFAISSSVGM